MKKALSLALALSFAFAASTTAFAAENSTVYEWTIENQCTTGDFESAAAGALPVYDQGTVAGADLTATGGWFSNPADIAATIEETAGVDGGKALMIAGDGVKGFGAAYWKLPLGGFADKDVIAVSFLYKVSDAMKAGTPQVHAHIIPNNVYSGGDAVAVVKDDPGAAGVTEETCGFDECVGTPVGDGWYRVTGTVACEQLGDRTFLRLFADFRQPDGTPFLGNDAYVLFDDVQVGKAVLKADEDAQANQSSQNLIQGGDFEDKGLGEQLGTDYDDLGWGSTVWDYESTSVVRDGDSKVLRLAGNNALNYGVALYKMPALTAEHTYRLSFDYKFIDNTEELTWQAHVGLLNNKQAGTAGGWYTVNLIPNPGSTLENGYTRVVMDITPSAFETSAITDLRFFIQLGSGNGSDTGIYIDNVALYDLADVDPEGPAGPTDPSDPEGPAGPTDPSDPEGPADPTNPSDPEGPSNPDSSNDPDDPSDMTDPTNPENPETGVASALPLAMLVAAASAAVIAGACRRKG